MKIFQADTQVTEEKSTPALKPLSGDGVKVFLNFDMDQAVYGALKRAAAREAVSVEQMAHKAIAHSMGYEVPQ